MMVSTCSSVTNVMLLHCNLFIIGMHANCFALCHEPAYEQPRSSHLRMCEVHPGMHATTLYTHWQSDMTPSQNLIIQIHEY